MSQFSFEPKKDVVIDPKGLYVLPGQALLELHSILLDQLPARFSNVAQTVSTIITCSDKLPQEEQPEQPLAVHSEPQSEVEA